MPRRSQHVCPKREAVEALSRSALADDQRLSVQRHLEDCESCRTLFRRETADNFPRIRQYTVIERVDEGGFGIVYKAIHHTKQRSEALKMLYGRTDARAAYFENEVHLVGKLRHPNIATLYDAHLSSPPLYYCMEFVEGRRLDRCLSSGEGTLADRINVVKIVASAIDYAHKQGVVHRDIKPQNIIIDDEGQPHIVDFGIARKLGLTAQPDAGGEASPDSPEGVVGTLGYMAPERAQGRKVDERGDIYSLGALLYHCVTGQPPRKLAGTDGLEKTLRELHIARPQDLTGIIKRCLAIDPDHRYRSAADLVAELGLPIPILACHAHFLADVGKDLLEPGHGALRKLLRRHKVRPGLRGLAREIGRKIGGAITGVREAVQAWQAQRDGEHALPEGDVDDGRSGVLRRAAHDVQPAGSPCDHALGIAGQPFAHFSRRGVRHPVRSGARDVGRRRGRGCRRGSHARRV
ncbi:MAG: serine/threonine protein kinase [Planctomycetes bacterium]|nr:serine/threonine protein kinase [Planctomycetota bacterium]